MEQGHGVCYCSPGVICWQHGLGPQRGVGERWWASGCMLLEVTNTVKAC